MTDEGRTEHEGPGSSDPDPGAENRNVPQFTLRGLLVFAAASSVCLSLAVSAAKCYENRMGPALASVAMVLTWLVLWEIHRRLRLRAALRVHWVPAVAVLVLAFAISVPEGVLGFGGALAPVDFLLVVLLVIGAACLVGCAGSVPVGVFTLAVVLWKRHRSRRRADRGE